MYYQRFGNKLVYGSKEYVKHHREIDKLWGRPQECESCHATVAKRFEWANLTGDYNFVRSDWKRLCVTCHRRLDCKRKVVCKYGHILSDDSVYIAQRGKYIRRDCKRCALRRSKMQKEKAHVRSALGE